MALKWGIAASGKISQDFVTAVSALPKLDHQVVAIAARSQSSADKFAKEHNVPVAYEGYEKLAKDVNVQVVYIGVLNPQHYEVTKLMLENGKHVLCEKPFTLNEQQTRELLDLAKQKNLFLMEAIWSRCFPVYDELKKILDSGELGTIYQVSVNFGFPLQNIERLTAKNLGGGATLDLGVYVLQLQQFVYRGLQPSKVLAGGHLNSQRTDSVANAIILYPEGKTATVTATAIVQAQNEAVISGTKGSVRIPNFWCPTQIIKNGQTINFPLIENKSKCI